MRAVLSADGEHFSMDDAQRLAACIHQNSYCCGRAILKVMIDVDHWTFMVIERSEDPAIEPKVIVPPVNVDAAKTIATSILTDRRSLPGAETQRILNYLATAVIALHGAKQ